MTKTLVLGLGNEILGDDAFGIHVVQRLIKEPHPEWVDLEYTSESGFYLLEHLLDYRRAFLIDTIISTELHPFTLILEKWSPSRLIQAPSLHYLSLGEAITFAKKMKLPIPDEIYVLALILSSYPEYSDRMSTLADIKVNEALEIIKRQVYLVPVENK